MSLHRRHLSRSEIDVFVCVDDTGYGRESLATTRTMSSGRKSRTSSLRKRSSATSWPGCRKWLERGWKRNSSSNSSRRRGIVGGRPSSLLHLFRLVIQPSRVVKDRCIPRGKLRRRQRRGRALWLRLLFRAEAGKARRLRLIDTLHCQAHRVHRCK